MMYLCGHIYSHAHVKIRERLCGGVGSLHPLCRHLGDQTQVKRLAPLAAKLSSVLSLSPFSSFLPSHVRS